ncbi:PA2778 family cysteine peptidase [Ramlibacter sp. PS4R-6]|uniref:PA2778 family cysteine peptidase n=1 Tax=Ramlibacter sp. PS4R-6 TaxID=3133438 RepID=UPI0030AD588C
MTAVFSPGARARAGLLLSAAALLLAGCAQLVPQTVGLRTDWPAGVPQTVELTEVPFFPQEDYECGPAALATVLVHTGVSVAPETLAKQVFLPARKGSLQVEMIAAPRGYDRVTYQLAPKYTDLLREVAAGNPVIVLHDVGMFGTQWHYSVVNGFDYPSGTVYLRSGKDRRLEMPFTYFERTWIAGKYWSMVVVPPDRIPATANENGWVNAVIAMARTSTPQAALTGYRTALARWPDNVPAAIGLASVHQARGETAQAITVLRSAQQRNPQSAIVANNLAQLLSDAGRHGEALAALDRVGGDPQGPFAAEIRSTRQLILQRIDQQKSGNRK